MFAGLDSGQRRRALLLIVAAIVVNIALGQLVQHVLRWPLYFDAIGAILVGALLGPLAGAVTGALSNMIVSVPQGNHAALPYAITAAFVGWAAGYAASLGAFRRLWTVLLAGFLVGVGAAIISAPITAYVFGGATGGGTDFMNSYLAAAGATLLQAATIQSFISDPLDKMISFFVAWLFWRPLRAWFPPLRDFSRQPLTSLSGYTLAVVLSLLSVMISFVFLPASGPSIFSVFYLAVLLSAWRGGLGPALFTTAVGASANLLLLISPYYNAGLSANDWFRTGVFVIVSIAIALIADQLERNRREVQEALQAERASEARLRATADGVNEALALISPEQRVLTVNRRFVELFDVPPDRLIGQRLDDLRTLYDQVFEEAEALFAASVATSSDAEQQYSRLIEQKWPHHRELLHYSTPVRDADGFLGRLYVFRDVTHEREVDRMKTEFVSLVSHELRTPLTSIKGFTEMVLDGDAGEVNEEVAEYLGIVYSNAERLVALVNDLLDLSRIESGRIQIKAEPVDLAAIVKLVVATMQPKVAEKQQQLSVEMDAAAANVVGDHDKLVQVLTNYVSNAHKYTQAGGAIRIEVGVEGDHARIAVIDNGHGIAPEDQDRLFTRFYRVDSELTREVGGTGLGLSIVKQLVELQGGATGVVSALGAGSTFWFTVPLQADAPAASRAAEPSAVAPVAPAPVAAAETVPAGAYPTTILVVEDDPDVARLIARHLQKAGYVVREAHSAEDALAAVAAAPPDLITLDLNLPAMQGDELARRLHADPLTSDIPIIVVSALAEDPALMNLGAYVLPKPIDQQALVGAVAQMLHGPERGPVLVIEDDADVRRLLEAALTAAGLEVVLAADGESGLARAGEQAPSLVLPDLYLPGMDGFAVLRALKEAEATANVPVIVISGNPEVKTTARARVLSLGAADLVAKPFEMDKLVQEIRLFLQA